MLSLWGKGVPLEAAGWLDESICPLLGLCRAAGSLLIPATEIDYFR